MLYDLNVPVDKNYNPNELQRTISFISELGYDSIALNYTITGALPSQIINEIPAKLPFDIPSKISILRRCTLQFADPTLNHRLPQLAATYDILALRPTTEKAFLAACTNLTEHSIISLDLTQRYPFHFKPKPFMAAVNRGVRFELCYAQATLEEAAKRRNVISNCLGIIRATKGRGLVISSEAKSVLGVRAPADVLNLLAVWGLSRDRGVEGMDINPRGVIVNEGIKRSSFRAVIDVVDGGAEGFVREVEKAPKKGKGTTGGNAGQKRKAEWEGDGAPPMSKRAAKRAKAEAAKALRGAPGNSNPPSNSETEIPSKTKPKSNG